MEIVWKKSFGILFELFVQTFYMEKDIKLNLEAPWEEVRERIKERNIDLTDSDLEYEPGKENELLSRLEKIMNKSRPEIIAYIESISANTDMAG
jgi:hypothetical protein